jgi:hypothetical protein
VVARIQVPGDVCEKNNVLRGEIYFRRPPDGPVGVQWIDGAGRIVEQTTLAAPASTGDPLAFAFSLARGLTYRNAIRVFVNGAPQLEGAAFLLAPAAEPWDDYHVISWAGYPDGYYDLLASAGIDATIAYRDDDFSAVLDNNVRFYVEQLAWEVFSIYREKQDLWRGLIQQLQANPGDWQLLVRKPCLNDPKTDDYVRERLTRMVRMHRVFRPLFYNIADELGHGDQIQPIDFCHSEHCIPLFAKYLRSVYGSPDRVGSEWGGVEIARWDDETVHSAPNWEHKDLMIARTTTDAAFEAIAFAGLRAKYGSVAGLNKAWNTSFPEPVGVGMSAREEWAPVLGAAREARSLPRVDEKALQEKLGSLEAVNVRWGLMGGWKTRQSPTGFKTWAEVAAFFKRYSAELAEIRSTEGWNVAPWCDFRNFMDATFAAAVRRAAAVCKAEDPDARCATEGGQAPAAFGWYNYEEVVRSVDAIEVYNTANNAEIVRSLNPNVVCIGTQAFEYTPGKALTDEDRTEQKRKQRQVWWQLLHGYRAAILWDDLEANYRFVTEGRQSTPAAEAFSPVFHEIRGGLGKLLLNTRRLHDRIGTHYSHTSIQVHWLLDNLQHERDWLVHHNDDRGHLNGIRNSWTKVIEDLGLQYDFVSREQIEGGKLASDEYRAFILPKSLAMSDREAQQLRDFVRAGGMLIADHAAARMNEHGRDLGRGQLDDVFGIRRGAAQKLGKSVTGVADAAPLRLAGRSLAFLKPAEAGVVVTTGQALAQSGSVPVVILNRFGRGQAAFLNLDVHDYGGHRLRGDIESSLPDLVEELLNLGQIQPRVRVRGRHGRRLRGVEVAVFANGECEHVALFRNPQADVEGLGDYAEVRPGKSGEEVDNSLLEPPEEITVEWPSPAQTYDVRALKDLGGVKTIQATLDPWAPLIYTRCPGPLPSLRVDAPTEVAAGSSLEVSLKASGSLPEGTLRVARMDVISPDGRVYDLYSRNVIVRARTHVERVPLAYNDAKGRWQVRAHDVMSGQTVEATVNVT